MGKIVREDFAAVDSFVGVSPRLLRERRTSEKLKPFCNMPGPPNCNYMIRSALEWLNHKDSGSSRQEIEKAVSAKWGRELSEGWEGHLEFEKNGMLQKGSLQTTEV